MKTLLTLFVLFFSSSVVAESVEDRLDKIEERLDKIEKFLKLNENKKLNLNENAIFTIDDAEKIGFNKDSEQGFEMIGAIDGWNGYLNDERVELYVYKDAERANASEDFFNFALDMGWKEICIVSNLAMMSKGETACSKLRESFTAD